MKESKLLKSITGKAFTGILLLLVLFFSSCDPQDGSGRKNMVSGKWHIPQFGAPMNSLKLYLHEEKGTGKVTGRNANGNFTVKGKMSGYSFIGSWEDSSLMPPNNKGTFFMDFNSDCSAFKGKIQFRKSTGLADDEFEGKSVSLSMGEATRYGVFTNEDWEQDKK
jgi:hypothetical protein